MGGRNDIEHRSIGLVVVGGNTSWERMSISAIMAVSRAGLCSWRREYAISILLILISRRYSCIVSSLFRLKKYSSIGKKVTGSWQAYFRQRSKRGFFVSQDESTQPRASSAFWSAPESNGRGGCCPIAWRYGGCGGARTRGKKVWPETVGPLWWSEGSSGVRAKGDYVAHHVKVSVSELCQQGLFLSNPNG